MGGKITLFNACRGKGREPASPVLEDSSNTPESLGPCLDILENPSGYRYFSPEEEKQYETYLPQQSRISDISPPKNWQSCEVLGHGSFGRVLFGANMDTGELIAIKQISVLHTQENKSSIDHIQQEIDILSQLHHKNIVRYLGTSRDDQHLNIFLEYVAGGSISSLLNRFGKFNESLIRVYTKQILEGLEYLHSHKIIHRDIKGANVLVSNEGVVKLADFGTAKKIYGIGDKTEFNSLRGTINWMAPEVMKQEGHGRYADIWSIGCTVLEMATAKSPWHNKPNPISVIMHVASTHEPPEIPNELSDQARDFILQCFKRRPSSRPNVCKLLKHSFIRDVCYGPIQIPKDKGPWEEAFASASTDSSQLNNYEIGSVIRTDEKVMHANRKESYIDETELDSLDPAHNLRSPFHHIIKIESQVKPQKSVQPELILRRPSISEEEDSFTYIQTDTTQASPQIMFQFQAEKADYFVFKEMSAVRE